MLGKILKHRKYKKMIKVTASSMLHDFIQIADETVIYFKKDGKIEGSDQQGALKYEATALIFWLFLQSGLFPEAIHKLILDEIYNQHYDRLRKFGYDTLMIQKVCDDFNARNEKYNEVFIVDRDYARVATQFVRFLSEGIEIEPNLEYLIIPMYISEKVIPVFDIYRDVIK